MLNRLETHTEPTRTSAARRRISLARTGAQILLSVAVLGGGLFAMNYLIAARPIPPKRPPLPTIYAVETVSALRGNHRPSFSVYGEVVAARTVDLRSLVAGEVVRISPSLKVGAQVEAGEPLVEIDRFDYEGAVREARANLDETMARIAESDARIDIEENKLARSEEQLQLAERDLERMKSLRDTGTGTEKQLDDRELILSQRISAVEQTGINISAEKAKLAQQQAAADRLRWKVEQAERNLANTVLAAPFSGIVRSAAVEKGRMLNVNDVAVSLYEGANLEVRFTLTDERFARLRQDAEGLIGRKIEVIWFARSANASYQGRIDRIGADIAAERGGVEIYASLDMASADFPIRPGAFVEMRIPDRQFNDHYRVPESAIYSGDTVYAVVENRLQARKVAVGAYDGEFALITGEVADGEELLATRITEIGDGLRVNRVGAAGQNVGPEAARKNGQQNAAKNNPKDRQ